MPAADPTVRSRCSVPDKHANLASNLVHRSLACRAGGRLLRNHGSGLSLNAAFNPRSNSIGFLRLVLALSVLLSHSFPLGGFNSGDDPLDVLSSRQFDFG